MMRAAKILLLLGFLVPQVATADDEDDVAQAFAKAANYVYSTDFIHDPVIDTFTEQELEILEDHPEALNAMIRRALGMQHSVGGALLTAHFDLEENLDLLRFRMLQEGRTYGWEGLYESDEERYYSDGQYVYHSRYLEVIEEITGKPMHEVIELTEHERNRIDRLRSSPRHESYHWAIWISRKLGI